MKKILGTLITGALLLPALVYANYDDVSLTSDSVITTSAASINVTGDSATIESITVNDGEFSVVLPPSSFITVKSTTGKAILTDAPSALIVTNTCDGGVATLKISVASTGATSTVSITPSANTCSGNATVAGSSGSGGGSSGGSGSSSGSSGGGGGGGGGSVAIVPSAPAVTTPAPTSGLTTTQIQAILTLLSSFGADQPTIDKVTAALNGVPMQGGGSAGTSGGAFTRNLEIGTTGDDVRALQVFLNTHGYVVTSSGPGSSGNETTLFGGLTKAALIKFQQANNITPAAGYFGPKTRAAVNGMQ